MLTAVLSLHCPGTVHVIDCHCFIPDYYVSPAHNCFCSRKMQQGTLIAPTVADL